MVVEDLEEIAGHHQTEVGGDSLVVEDMEDGSLDGMTMAVVAEGPYHSLLVVAVVGD